MRNASDILSRQQMIDDLRDRGLDRLAVEVAKLAGLDALSDQALRRAVELAKRLDASEEDPAAVG
jgi:hypothetical protein